MNLREQLIPYYGSHGRFYQLLVDWGSAIDPQIAAVTDPCKRLAAIDTWLKQKGCVKTAKYLELIRLVRNALVHNNKLAPPEHILNSSCCLLRMIAARWPVLAPNCLTMRAELESLFATIPQGVNLRKPKSQPEVKSKCVYPLPVSEPGPEEETGLWYRANGYKELLKRRYITLTDGMYAGRRVLLYSWNGTNMCWRCASEPCERCTNEPAFRHRTPVKMRIRVEW